MYIKVISETNRDYEASKPKRIERIKVTGMTPRLITSCHPVLCYEIDNKSSVIVIEAQQSNDYISTFYTLVEIIFNREIMKICV